MQVRELVSSGSFTELRLLTGEHGLENNMKDVVLLEYDSLMQQRQDYYNGDFIISTLYFAKDHPDKFYSTVERLIRMGASGLAFKSSYYTAPPESVLQLAREKNFPIFIFDDLYIEDVILTISDYMRLRQEFSLYEDSIFKILQGSAEGYSVEQLCASMNPNRRKYMNAVYVHASDMTSDWVNDLRNTLQLRHSRKHTSQYRFLQFRRGFFVLSNYTEPVALSTIAENVKSLMENLGCEPGKLCFGVSELHQRSMEFDCVIRESFDALLVALSEGTQIKLSPDLRLYRAIFPTLRDKTMRTTMMETFQRLEQYDKESASGFLLGTLKAYAQCRYDIKATAETLSQHPNTIRYRLKKICDLAASPLEGDHALFLMGEFIKMDNLCSAIY